MKGLFDKKCVVDVVHVQTLDPFGAAKFIDVAGISLRTGYTHPIAPVKELMEKRASLEKRKSGSRGGVYEKTYRVTMRQ